MSSKRKSKYNYLHILLVLGFVCLVGGVGYYLGHDSASEKKALLDSSLPNNTSSDVENEQNMLTYTNTESNFTLQYPKDWKLVESETGDRITFEGPDSENSLELPSTITIIPFNESEDIQNTVGNYGVQNEEDYDIFDINEKRFIILVHTYQYGTSREQGEMAADFGRPVMNQIISSIKPLQ